MCGSKCFFLPIPPFVLAMWGHWLLSSVTPPMARKSVLGFGKLCHFRLLSSNKLCSIRLHFNVRDFILGYKKGFQCFDFKLVFISSQLWNRFSVMYLRQMLTNYSKNLYVKHSYCFFIRSLQDFTNRSTPTVSIFSRLCPKQLFQKLHLQTLPQLLCTCVEISQPRNFLHELHPRR